MIGERPWPYVRILNWDINLYMVAILMVIGYLVGAYWKQPIVGVAVGGCAAALLSPQLKEV